MESQVLPIVCFVIHQRTKYLKVRKNIIVVCCALYAHWVLKKNIASCKTNCITLGVLLILVANSVTGESCCLETLCLSCDEADL